MGPRCLTVFLVALALLVTGCSRGDDDEKASPPKPTTTTALTAPPALTWTITGVEANGTQPPGEDVVAAVKATLDTYLTQAVATPLFSGTPPADLSAVLSPAALDRIAADPAARAALIDEGMPPATKSITANAANAALSSVAGADGATALVVAALDLRVHAVGPTVEVNIVRTGEVVLAPEANGWRIDSFSVNTHRDSVP